MASPVTRTITSTDLLDLGIGEPGESHLKAVANILKKSTNSLLEKSPSWSNLLNYGDAMGDKVFREELSKFINSTTGDHTKCLPDNLMLTCGVTHATYFLTSYLFSTGSTVILEDPTFVFIIDLFRHDLGMNLVSIPRDDAGIDVDALDAFLSSHPNKNKNDLYSALIYVIPTFHNPCGTSMEPKRCVKLINVARKHNALVISDDVYSMLDHNSPNTKIKPRRLIDYDRPEDSNYNGGHVVSTGSFSKIMCPGVRVGWIQAPSKIIEILSKSETLQGGGASNQYMSMVLAESMKLGFLQQHLKSLKSDYKVRLQLVCQTLRNHLPSCVDFDEPEGGFFLWLRLPEGSSTNDLQEISKEKFAVSFLPGQICSPKKNFNNCLRIPISRLELDDLEEGVQRLCAAIKYYLQTVWKHDLKGLSSEDKVRVHSDGVSNSYSNEICNDSDEIDF